MRRILLLDDENNVLMALKRSLRQLYTTAEMNIETFDDPKLAILRFGEVSFDFVIVDYHMPTMNGVDCLRIISYGFLFYAYGMVLGQSFNGAGDTWTPTIINLFVFWLWELPLAYVLAISFGMGPRGVFIAITIAFSTLAVVSAVVFRRGRWKTRVV